MVRISTNRTDSSDSCDENYGAHLQVFGNIPADCRAGDVIARTERALIEVEGSVRATIKRDRQRTSILCLSPVEECSSYGV
jgi:hypothetical protein